ncbi:MAG TPA: hypothetical protein VLX61_15420 [Anaerolineales bacterium]|nr:hypothetical protein [Anaerolineales bacterium]
MLILITALLLFLTALAVVILQIMRPEFRFTWLTAVGGALLAWISVLLWQPNMPLSFDVLSWRPTSLFSESPAFSAEMITWPYALGLVTLAVAILLTASVDETFTSAFAWAGSLTLCGLGLLAITAANPLTLALVWAALDLAELIITLRSINDSAASERTVISFATRAAGIGLLVWANVLTAAAGKSPDFSTIAPQAGLYLLMASGFRLGVLPLHLPYSSESTLRRGFGTALRLVSAASSLVVLAHIPASSLASPLTPFLLILAAIAGIYGGWMWLRAPQELIGRPFWVIGLASLAVAATLFGNPVGTVVWGTAMILVGGALFLASAQQTWISRALLIGAFSLSALPFSLTAAGWQGNTMGFWYILPLLLVAQALLMTGYIRSALRPSTRSSLASQPIWTRSIYPIGIGFLLFNQILLGVWGWNGALKIGGWEASIFVSLLTLGLLWAIPRFPSLNPMPAHWTRPSFTPALDRLYENLWAIYRWLARFSQAISDILEGDSGIMWTLLFLVLFISLMTQRKP